jgi:hypothetical protein
MLRSTFHSRLFWIAIAYITVIASALYPALHEGFGIRIFLWNCVPPTIGLILVLTAMGGSKSRLVISTSFAVLVAIGEIFFFAAWFFTPLDTDPHSATTKFVFVFGPVVSFGLALIASAIGWLVAKTRS